MRIETQRSGGVPKPGASGAIHVRGMQHAVTRSMYAYVGGGLGVGSGWSWRKRMGWKWGEGTTKLLRARLLGRHGHGENGWEGNRGVCRLDADERDGVQALTLQSRRRCTSQR